MKTMRPSKSSHWQTERQRRVHLACLLLERAVARGDGLKVAASRISRRHNGKPFRCDGSRTLKLSAKTLIRCYYIWKRKGAIPAGLRLNFRSGLPPVPAPVVIEFARFCTSTRHQTIKAAWNKFSRMPRWIKRCRRCSIFSIYLYVSAPVFYRVQAQFKAQMEAARLSFGLVEEIRQKLACRTNRTVKPIDFSI